MKKILIPLFLLLFQLAFGQTNNKVYSSNNSTTDTKHPCPIYPGCEDAQNKRKCFSLKMRGLVEKNFNKCAIGKTSTNKIRLFTSCIINEEGFVQDVEVKAPHQVFLKEVKRVYALIPAMQPSIKDGKPQNYLFRLPIIFTYRSNDCARYKLLRPYHRNSKNNLKVSYPKKLQEFVYQNFHRKTLEKDLAKLSYKEKEALRGIITVPLKLSINEKGKPVEIIAQTTHKKTKKRIESLVALYPNHKKWYKSNRVNKNGFSTKIKFEFIFDKSKRPQK